jgi:hypothetical protein
MNKVCIALVALFLISQAVALDCLSGDTGTCSGNEDGACSWYNDADDCCADTCSDLKAAEDDETDDEEPPCEVKEKCTDQYNLLSCGAICTPNWTLSEDEDPSVLSVCEKFADKLYSSCKDSEFGATADDCKAVSELFDDAEAFVKGLVAVTSGGLADATLVDGDDCLNSATSAVVSAAVVVAAALLA